MRTNELQHRFFEYLETVPGATEELVAAQKIQQLLLQDDLPINQGLTVAGVSIPAYQLSGDYYDFITDDERQRVWVLIGDVMGKGIPAALIMVMLRATVRCLVSVSDSPGELLSKLNNLLLKDLTRLKAFSSLFCGYYDEPSSLFYFATAGHPNPVYYSAKKNSIRKLEAKGTIIGILKDRIYQNHSLPLAKGDLLLLCTDGVLEAVDKNNLQVSYEMVMDLIMKHKDNSLQHLIEQIIEGINCGTDQFRRDDVTIAAVRCEEEGGND
ncbi:MAG TPA: PP2C family protein-serine/threonine phosphatase [Bacilli bacterium]|nr:PP2C family protein-serine/threonine phosphatase [Bacilli bacterium]